MRRRKQVRLGLDNWWYGIGKAFAEIVANCSKEALMPIIKGKILEGATIHTDGWKSYDGLILNGYKHYRVFHSENEFASGESHVKGIELFGAFAKRCFAKFNGCKNELFMIHLRGCEFHFNHGNENLYKIIKKLSNLYEMLGKTLFLFDKLVSR
jgi:transposase-like protein